MTPAARWTSFALAGWVVGVVGIVGALVVRVAWPAPLPPITFGLGGTSVAAICLLGITWSTVGAILVTRRPDNPVGRLMVLIGAGSGLGVLGIALAAAGTAVDTPGASRLAEAGGVLASLLTSTLVLVFYLPLIFPTGRGHTVAWHRVARVMIAILIFGSALIVFHPGDSHLLAGIANPIGFGPDLRPVFGDPFAPGLSIVLSAPMVPVVVLSVVTRYRSGGRVERQQLKWY